MSFLGREASHFPSPERRLRLGFVGGGRGSFIGAVHANGARLSNRWETVAGALSSDPAVSKESGKDWLFASDRIYTDWAEMAEHEAERKDGIEAVVISTPNHLHKEIAAKFMSVGIDVICDKPLATSLKDALELVELQRKTGLVFGVTYAFSCHPIVRQAREMVRNGSLGRIRQIHVEYVQDWATGPDDPGFKGARRRREPKQMGRAGVTGT